MNETSSSSRSLPAWFRQGHLRDDIARQFQEKTDTTAVYLRTLIKPELGMRTETSIGTRSGLWIHLSGIVTWVGEEPSCEELISTRSFFYELLCMNSAADTLVGIETSAQKKALISQHFGCVHGQRMTSVGRRFDDGNESLPFSSNEYIETKYRFNDSMFYPWAVESFRVLSDDEARQLPFSFYQFYEGCACPRCHAVAQNETPAFSFDEIF